MHGVSNKEFTIPIPDGYKLLDLVIQSNLLESLPVNDATIAELQVSKSLISLLMLHHNKLQFLLWRRLPRVIATLVGYLFSARCHVLEENSRKHHKMDKK